MRARLLLRRMLRHRARPCPECGENLRDTYCDVCGYDLVQRSKDTTFHRPVV